MPVVFADLKKRKGPFSEKELEAMADRTALLHHYVDSTAFGELLKTANQKRRALQDEPNVIFTADHSQPESIEAARVTAGVAMDAIGASEIAIKLTSYAGEKLAGCLTVKEAVALCGWIIGAVDHLASRKGGLTAIEKREMVELRDGAGRMLLEIDGTSERMSAELAKEYGRRADAQHYSSLAALERKAEETVRKEYEGAIRKLAQAAAMPSGLEKSALLEECAPIIRKAFA